MFKFIYSQSVSLADLWNAKEVVILRGCVNFAWRGGDIPWGIILGGGGDYSVYTKKVGDVWRYAEPELNISTPEH